MVRMTDQHEKVPSGSRLVGKWQMPLFGLSLCAFGFAAWLAFSSSPEVSWEQEFEEVQALTDSAKDGDYSAALEAGYTLLEATGKSQQKRRGRVWIQLAEIHWRSIEYTGGGDSPRWMALRDEYLQARRAGETLTAEMCERLGRAHEALDEPDEAISQYQLAKRLAPERAGWLGQRIIELSVAGRGLSPDTLGKRLEAYLQTKDLADQQYAWAVGRLVGLLIGRRELDRARLFVDRQQTTVRSEAAGFELKYQLARVLKELGLTDQAADQLDLLIGVLDEDTSPGDLAARARLLQGQLIWRDNPQEAATVLDALVSRHPDGDITAAAMLTLAQAYSALQMPDEALGKYELAIEVFRRNPDTPYVTLADIREAMGDSRRELQVAGRPEMALRFIEAERQVFDMDAASVSVDERLDLLERLAKARRALAAKAKSDHQEAKAAKAEPSQLADLDRQRRENFRLAGHLLLERAALAVRDHDEIYGQSLWQAAEAFDQAGSPTLHIDTLKRFVNDRPDDPRTPKTRFLLGQALQARKRWDEAIRVYKANLLRGMPAGRHPQALAGLIPLAECYIAKGEKFYAEAEKVLVGITDESDVVTAQSEMYRKALFVLGKLYFEQGKWRAARLKLDEAIQRDPGRWIPLSEPDPQGLRTRYFRATRSMYRLAACYRQSAREAAKEAAEAEDLSRRVELLGVKTDQLVRADQLFQSVIERMEATEGPLDRQNQLYRRNSYFRRGDCMFELRRYRKAIDRYQEGVFHYGEDPAALGVLVAIANCHYALGEVAKARAAMERSRELLNQIDPKKLEDDGLLSSREFWQNYLDAAARADPTVVSKGKP